jgi:hypothetical protein
MTFNKNLFLFLIAFSLIGCGKNNDAEEEQITQSKEPDYEQKTAPGSGFQKKDSIIETVEDSIKAVKESVLKKQRFKRKKQLMSDNNQIKAVPETETISKESSIQNTIIPSFIYIKLILEKCKIGVPMTQKDLEKNYNIPKEGIQLVKSITKISENELDVKWKSTWLIEKISDAKFKDGRLKVRFDKDKMYTSGGAIAIKHEKKLYTDLLLVGQSAYIPKIKGFYWQIGKD